MNNNNLNPQAIKLYENILETANMFLVSANRFTIVALQKFDPSFEDLAKIMQSLGKIVYDLADEVDPLIAAQAMDYCNLMNRMAVAIRNHDTTSLSEAVKELEKKPFR